MNKPHTQETKEKISRARMGQVLSENHRRQVVKTLRHDSGSKNPNWKGGRTFRNGYALVRIPSHPYAQNGYVLEHRHIMEQEVGRILERSEVVHHINGNKLDNRIENLIILTSSAHTKEHWTDERREKYSAYMSRMRAERPWSTRTKTQQTT